MTRESRWLQVAVLVPMLGLLLLVARAEVLLRSSESFRVAISGYDPRDLLHGHYLQYTFDLDWHGESTCGRLAGGVPLGLDASCCVCLTTDVDADTQAQARQVACDQVSTCDGWLQSATLTPPLRYFVPERHASELEEALRGRQAALTVTCGPGGQPAIGELSLDGKPWREVIDR
jgi:uncharacterized membrane-anchored protein